VPRTRCTRFARAYSCTKRGVGTHEYLLLQPCKQQQRQWQQHPCSNRNSRFLLPWPSLEQAAPPTSAGFRPCSCQQEVSPAVGTLSLSPACLLRCPSVCLPSPTPPPPTYPLPQHLLVMRMPAMGGAPSFAAAAQPYAVQRPPHVDPAPAQPPSPQQPQPQPRWQKASDGPARLAVARSIVPLLRARGSVPSAKVQHAVRVLELMLYRSAPGIDAYLDVDTLRARVERLVNARLSASRAQAAAAAAPLQVVRPLTRPSVRSRVRGRVSAHA
jgi:hypothetical protein